MEPVRRIEDVPWDRIVHFYGRATEVPELIAALDSDEYEAACGELEARLEHQDGLCQATPFAVHFVLRALREKRVRDPEAVRAMLKHVLESARYTLGLGNYSGTPTWEVLLAEEQLWPEFVDEMDDEKRWEEWDPGDFIEPWAKLTEIELAALD